jgi:hypothetical protein
MIEKSDLAIAGPAIALLDFQGDEFNSKRLRISFRIEHVGVGPAEKFYDRTYEKERCGTVDLRV